MPGTGLMGMMLLTLESRDNSEMTFFSPKTRCACTDNQISCSANGNAFLLYIDNELQYRGNYCDFASSANRHFICETSTQKSRK